MACRFSSSSSSPLSSRPLLPPLAIPTLSTIQTNTLRSPPPHFVLRFQPRRRRYWRCPSSSDDDGDPTIPSPSPSALHCEDDDDESLQASLSRFEDKVRIFFAVLFWMSLFFWGSAWDGRKDNTKKKGPWFRK